MKKVKSVWNLRHIFIASLFVLFAANTLFAADAKELGLMEELQRLDANSLAGKPILLMSIMVIITMLPFASMLLTSFLKIAVVLSIARQAVGTQQAPPTMVITGLSIILSIYVMQPVGMQIYNKTQSYMQSNEYKKDDSSNKLFSLIKVSQEPMLQFLTKHSSDKTKHLFYSIAKKMRSKEENDDLKINSLIIVVPSFIISELTKAFQIGFLIFLPFLIVDMTIANLLMALGMQMLSPTAISLPFKILLFVLVDGWFLVSRGLVLSYH